MIAIVVAAHRPRLPDLLEMVESMEIASRSDLCLVVVTTQPQPILATDLPFDFTLAHTNSEEINLARWYNLGMARARELEPDYILWSETDVRLPYASMQAMKDALDLGYSYVGPNYTGFLGEGIVEHRADQEYRIVIGTMVAAHTVYEADERFAWWYEMDDIEYRARTTGRAAIVGSAHATHRGELVFKMPQALVEISAAGRKLFMEKWETIESRRYPHGVLPEEPMFYSLEYRRDA